MFYCSVLIKFLNMCVCEFPSNQNIIFLGIGALNILFYISIFTLSLKLFFKTVSKPAIAECKSTPLFTYLTYIRGHLLIKAFGLKDVFGEDFKSRMKNLPNRKIGMQRNRA